MIILFGPLKRRMSFKECAKFISMHINRDCFYTLGNFTVSKFFLVFVMPRFTACLFIELNLCLFPLHIQINRSVIKSEVSIHNHQLYISSHCILLPSIERISDDCLYFTLTNISQHQNNILLTI